MALDPAWIALIGTVLGGTGLKIAEKWLERPRDKTDDATKIRDELRLEITRLSDDLSKTEAEVDEWRNKYYDLRDKYGEVQTQLQILKERIEQLQKESAAKAQDLDQSPPA